jgi:hypothetical protein
MGVVFGRTDGGFGAAKQFAHAQAAANPGLKGRSRAVAAAEYRPGW